jgi:hypothetical protein
MKSPTADGPALLAAVLVLLVRSAADADLYRWTDERGEEHFSNLPGDAPTGAVVEPVPSGGIRNSVPVADIVATTGCATSRKTTPGKRYDE